MDAVSRKEFWEMLQKLKKNFGLPVIVSTPYMDEAVQCDRIALIQDGRFLTIDTPQAIINNYSGELWAVKSNQMHKLLTDLRETDGVKTAFAFGEDYHATIDTAKLTADMLKEKLTKLRQGDLHIKKVEPSIEDCFMNLQN